MKPSQLEDSRWQRIDEILDAAMDQPPDDVPAFLDRVCEGDDTLRQDVESLLRVREDAERKFERLTDLALTLVPEEDTHPSVNSQIGPFRVSKEIGRGGMGVVYLAEDTRLGRKVALKVLSSRKTGADGEAQKRLSAEARAVSALDHPNIATLHDVGTTRDGHHYMVFAYYEGETLEQKIARAPLSPGESLDIAIQLAGALERAHESDIIHRDVKPSNVLITHSGEAKLLDFGVAIMESEINTPGSAQPGTPAYMSPEQASGDRIDHRTDLWSLGAVLHEMTTGERPTRTPGDDSTTAIRESWARKSGVRAELGRILSRLLRERPEDRYATASDLLGDLSSLRQRTQPHLGTDASTPITLWQRFGRRTVLPGGLFVLVVIAVWIAFGSAQPSGGRLERVAVMPFVNRANDADQQHVVDGIHEALIAELGKIGTLSVLSRASVARYRRSEQSIPEIGQGLDVDAVLAGSALRVEDTLSITLKLHSVSPERQLWSRTFRRDMSRAPDIPRDAVRLMASEVEITLNASESSRLSASRTVDPAAYDVYLQGRFQLDQRTRESFDLARKYFRRAIEIDSSFAPPYALLAEALGSAAFFGMQRPRDVMPRVTSLVRAALKRDSLLADAHATMAAIELYWSWDLAAARESAERAIELNASFPRAYRILSEVFLIEGQYDAALDAVEHASSLDGLVPFSAFRPVATLYYMGRYDQAAERAREGLEFFSDFWQGHYLYCLALTGSARYSEATLECRAAARASGRAPMALGALGYVYAVSGHRGEAEAILTELLSTTNTSYVGPSYIAGLFGALNQTDRAFDWLERALRERDPVLVHAPEHIIFEPLRDDPRFDVLLQSVGLGTRVSARTG